MIDLLQSIAILTMGIGVILNSVRIKNLTESVRCPHIHPANDLRCRLHYIWPITPN